MLARILAVVGLIAAWGTSGHDAQAQTESSSDSESVRSQIDDLVGGEMAARGIPGLQLTILRHNKIVFTRAYGQADVEAAVSVTDDTVFPINSISKAISGVAAMQLVEANLLMLDAPLTAYLDGLPQSWSDITVRHILTHMSGLPEIANDNLRLIDCAEPEAAWLRVQELPLTSSPGTYFDYTQTNYVVLGKIIEKVTGEPFTDYVRRRQFDPSGMTRTRFGGAEGNGAQLGDASLYTHLTLKIDGMKTVGAERSAVPFRRQERWREFLYPAGGVQSTSADLAKWVSALQDHRLVSEQSLAALWAPQPQRDGTYRGFNAIINGYGLGWPSARRDSHPAVTPVGGARAAMFIYPEDDLTIIVLTNLMGASPQQFIDRIASAYIPGLIIE